MDKTKHFVFILVDEFSHIAFSCAVEPLRIANLVSGKDLYQWSYISDDGISATCSNGSVTLVHHGYNDIPKNEQLFVLSGIHVKEKVTSNLLNTLRRERAQGAKIGALCSGAYILAKAGFLNEKQAAIHWEFHDSFMEEFPEVNLVRNVFVADEKVITASGGTATADLMLHLIENAHGQDLAIAVSDQMVYNAVRDATAEQRVSLQSRHGMRNPHMAKAIQEMNDTLETPVSSTVIANNIGISVRQLERLFGKYLNCSPKKYYVEMRLEKARHLLIQTDNSITEIAHACGFESSGHFTRVYRATFGVTPSLQRGKMT
ncbi:GlxA family transcriptional regulator [Cochlodiniinecator piscidefendens]|uniref:GlxA family transcriptional regulator n=1 Tax=Cochlodiniinecator piscidefendens TaxID=2715756 RepID=UPI0014086FDB|nr:GlxA family transcriptional regulator [Cochlodiniinecator piscidefendens]